MSRHCTGTVQNKQNKGAVIQRIWQHHQTAVLLVYSEVSQL